MGCGRYHRPRSATRCSRPILPAGRDSRILASICSKSRSKPRPIIGSPYIVIHPINIALYERDKELDFERNMEAFARLKPVLDEFGVRLGVENMFGWDGVRRRNCPTGCRCPRT